MDRNYAKFVPFSLEEKTVDLHDFSNSYGKKVKCDNPNPVLLCTWQPNEEYLVFLFHNPYQVNPPPEGCYYESIIGNHDLADQVVEFFRGELEKFLECEVEAKTTRLGSPYIPNDMTDLKADCWTMLRIRYIGYNGGTNNIFYLHHDPEFDIHRFIGSIPGTEYRG